MYDPRQRQLLEKRAGRREREKEEGKEVRGKNRKNGVGGRRMCVWVSVDVCMVGNVYCYA